MGWEALVAVACEAVGLMGWEAIVVMGCEVVLADAVACEVLVVGKIMDKRQTH